MSTRPIGTKRAYRVVPRQNATHLDLNNLGRLFRMYPDVMLPHIDRLFSSENYHTDTTLTSTLMNLPNEAGIDQCDSLEWEWSLKNMKCRPAVVLEDIEPQMGEKRGSYKRKIRVKWDTDIYQYSDEMSPKSPDNKKLCRIVGKQPAGDKAFIYTLEFMSDDDDDGVPKKYFERGREWVKMFSSGSEGTDSRGSTSIGGDVSFSSWMGKLTKEYSVTDYAHNALEYMHKNAAGEETMVWLNEGELPIWREWKMEREKRHWFSRGTKSGRDRNGRRLQRGPGIHELLEDSYRDSYSVLSGKFLSEYMNDIYFNKLAPGSPQRHMEGYAGMQAMENFHNAIEQADHSSGFFRNVNTYTNKVDSPHHTNALEYGYQYVKYVSVHGSTMTLKHNPIYDNPDLSEIDPRTGRPIESGRITFLDFKEKAGKANVRIKQKRGGFAFAYKEGLWGPEGAKNGQSVATLVDGYSMGISSTEGIHIDDTSRCGSLLPY